MININAGTLDYLKVSFFSGYLVYFILFCIGVAVCIFLMHKFSNEKLPFKSAMGMIFCAVLFMILIDISSYLGQIEFVHNKYAVEEIEREIGQRFVNVTEIVGSVDNMKVTTKTPSGYCTSYFNYTSLLKTDCN
ncbi:hypothetical protein ACILPN_22920 (plasmid) [Yersinia wautersii]|uniref:Uncharacterized protein n=1 Tax=Yersinia pseudotuberculosis TaxID=633 RepID=A0A380SBJ4_YERPU|nr:hypothetical protein [Yersinia pseudotuberculosis]SUQ39512.1 Uncharacterised protein [Yersinia pseudotuberculosis]